MPHPLFLLKIIFLMVFLFVFQVNVFAAAPAVGTITSSNITTAPNVALSITTTFTDADGWQNLKEAYLLISTSTTTLTNSCYLYYDQNLNLLYLRNDTNTAWLGGFKPGTANTIENTYVKLNCASSTATGSSSTLTVKWNITFKSTYSGKIYDTYLSAVDDTAGVAPLVKKGTCIVNNSPVLGTITPSSGTKLPSTSISFTTTYTDADGWANLKEAYLLISTATTALTNSCYLYYDQNANLLYLRDDTNSSWGTGYTPGSASILENSYIKLDCATITVTGSTNTLTIKWSITFKPAYSGKLYNTYLSVKDDVDKTVVLTKKGTITVNTTPVNGTVTPSSGTGQANVYQNFTTTYTDADGWQNIQYVYFLINSSTSAAQCFEGYYNQNTNLLYLRDDNGSSTWLGGYTPGSSNIIENSFGKLDCSKTTISGSGTTLTINWQVALKSPFTGAKKTYLYVRDDVNTYQNLTQKGNWVLPNQAPQIGTITPINSISSPEQILTFSTTYSDADTSLNIQYAYFLINTAVSGANGFYGYYDRGTNKLYLRNDTNTAWLGGFNPGSAQIIENTYCRLDCAKTTVTAVGNTLSLNWQLTFKSAFLGRKNVYLYVKDFAGANSGWVQKGTWTIQSDITPPTGSIKVMNANLYFTTPCVNTTTITLGLSADDGLLGSGVSQMQFSNDNSAWSAPENYSTTKSWTILSGDGVKFIYVKYKDFAGNWSESFFTVAILDTVKPVIQITSPQNGEIIR